MADLIDRQAAIDALEKVAGLFPYRVPGDRDSYGSYPEAWNDAIGRAEMEIEKLPSAQPEPLTDKEQRIFLAAMAKEEKVCAEVDRNYVREPYEDSLMSVCKTI